jgi:HD-GYP domain-containing protein (c-di-GMP phosphodiesterase class II)
MTAIERATADARSMPGNLISHERLDDLTGAARAIIGEVDRLPEAPYDLTGADHPIDVTIVGLAVGRRLELPGDSLHELGLGLFLQDIGMLALPPAIVDKPGPLDDAELELMRRHPQRGLDLLREEDVGSGARAVIRHHHERWDGAGYPYGLAGQEIPLFARIAALAQAFSATPSQPAGIEALRAGSGQAFDPELVDVLEDVAMARSPGLRAVAAA